MGGHPYDYGAMILSAASGGNTITSSGETIDWLHDTINIALMGSGYTQDVTSQHWSQIVGSEITSSGYTTGGVPLTPVAPYIEITVTPFRYLVYNANAASTPAYSVLMGTGLTFTDIVGAAVYKVGGTTATSPLLCFISDLSIVSASGDKYYIVFGAPGVGLGIYHRQLF